MDKQRVRLQWCETCQKDYRATEFRRENMWRPQGVTGWKCPKGHVNLHCDENIHNWIDDEDGIAQKCTRCGAWKIDGLSMSH